MKTFGLIAIAILAVVVIGVIGLVGRGCNTASKMADKTVFNADKHVWTYEEFRNQVASFDQHNLTFKNAERRIGQLETKERTDTPEYNNSVMMRDGAYQMMARIASNYNKMAMVAYQKVWKGDLPARLDLPDIG